jgi:hypothetical protein
LTCIKAYCNLPSGLSLDVDIEMNISFVLKRLLPVQNKTWLLGFLLTTAIVSWNKSDNALWLVQLSAVIIITLIKLVRIRKDVDEDGIPKRSFRTDIWFPGFLSGVIVISLLDWILYYLELPTATGGEPMFHVGVWIMASVVACILNFYALRRDETTTSFSIS